jgi:hypothetical protein
LSVDFLAAVTIWAGPERLPVNGRVMQEQPNQQLVGLSHISIVFRSGSDAGPRIGLLVSRSISLLHAASFLLIALFVVSAVAAAIVAAVGLYLPHLVDPIDWLAD